jgi:integrase/recombinase XerD
MLIDDAHRYIRLRRALGFKLEKTDRYLVAFIRHALANGDSHIRTATALAWTAAVSSTPGSRYRRLQEIADFARFLHAEDAAHEIPQHHRYYRPCVRPAPYIYTPDELVRMLHAATGLRVSEALNLRLGDLLPDGVLHIRQTKFNKSRLVPMHASAVAALDAYVRVRAKVAGVDDHVFLTVGGRPMGLGTVHAAFHVILNKAKIAPDRPRRPRIHDLRHTFATRALAQCAMRREDVARDFVALSTYLGHGDIRHTYWYLEATPGLMGDIADAAEILAAEVVA